MKTLIVDNYDSFTFNLFQLVGEVNGEEPIVVRNDDAAWEEIAGWTFDNVVISPGPGTPERASDIGVCADLVRHTTVPMLGVCLGHQLLGVLAGGTMTHAPEVAHGRVTTISHDSEALFAGLPQGFQVVLYHSLCLTEPLPAGLEAVARSAEGVLMGLRDRSRPHYGVQFHPESVCTEHGRALLANFRDLTRRSRPHGRAGGAAGRSIVRVRPSRRADPGAGLRLLTRRLNRVPRPERAYLELYRDDTGSWWLDSSGPRIDGPTVSYMGGSDGGPLAARVEYDVETRCVKVNRPGRVETFDRTILDHLRLELDRLDFDVSDVPFGFVAGFVGYLGYEVKADCGGAAAHPSPLPDAVFRFVDRVLAFDHQSGTATAMALVDDGSAAAGEAWLDGVEMRLVEAAAASEVPAGVVADPSVEPRWARPRAQYLADIAACQRQLVEGESYEICLTNRIDADLRPDPVELHLRLRRINPAPFAALFRDGERAVVCSSPEQFLRIGRDRWVEARPIKGTARRSGDAAEDAALADSLRADPKAQAENLMITDLLRNDLGWVCEIGTVEVPSLFAVESYETVHQLVSTVRGRLREGLHATDCVRACFPPGSMTGAPKRRTMEIIDELEGEARGVYSGAIGTFGVGGTADLNVVIRTIVCDGEGISIGTGGAIVSQSDPQEEIAEMELKAEAPLRALGLRLEPPRRP